MPILAKIDKRRIFIRKILLLVLFAVSTLIYSCSNNSSSNPVTPPTTYSNVKITKLSITAIPFLNSSGASWDVSSGPDPYFVISSYNDVSKTSIITGAAYQDIKSTDLPLSWNFTNAMQITNLDTKYLITVYDEDTLVPDTITTTTFLPNDYKNTYPATVVLTNSSGSMSLTLTLTWY